MNPLFLVVCVYNNLSEAATLVYSLIKQAHTMITVIVKVWTVQLQACTYIQTPLSAPSGSPGCLTVKHRSPTTEKLSWAPVPEEELNGDITGYTVQVVGPDHSTVYYSTDATSIEISDLNPFTRYTFEVSVKTTVGSGQAASIQSITLEGG